LIYDGVAFLDFAGPLEALAHAGVMYRVDGKPAFEVFTVAPANHPIALSGLKIVPERTLTDEVRADILIVPGGANEPLISDTAAMSRLAKLAQGAEICMSVCNGAWILGAMGLLDGVEATSTSPEALQRKFPRARVVTGRRCVDAGRVITTPEGLTGVDAALRIIERGLGRDAAEQVAAHLAYPWAPSGAGTAGDAHATGEHTVPDMPEWRRFYLAAVEKLDGTDGVDPSQALRWLRGSFQRGNPRPGDVLSDPALAKLRNEPALRGQLRTLLAEYAREATIQLVAPDEPGEPLIVSGAVRDSAGKPVEGALIQVFHTDQRGYYSELATDEANPRLFGFMKTGPDGRYEFRTIRPGHYPDQSEPVEQHIHVEVTASGYAPKSQRLAFADDPIWKRPALREDPFWSKHMPFPPTWAARVTRAADGVDRCECSITLTRESEAKK